LADRLESTVSEDLGGPCSGEHGPLGPGAHWRGSEAAPGALPMPELEMERAEVERRQQHISMKRSEA